MRLSQGYFMKTVIAFGSFDVLHLGHIRYLSAARKLGDRLVVIVARDESIELFKGSRPLFDQYERLKMVSALRMVDASVLGNKLARKSDMYNIFLRYRPSVIALGFDQRADIPELREWLLRHGIDARIVRIRHAMRRSRYRSSALKRKLGSL